MHVPLIQAFTYCTVYAISTMQPIVLNSLPIHIYLHIYIYIHYYVADIYNVNIYIHIYTTYVCGYADDYVIQVKSVSGRTCFFPFIKKSYLQTCIILCERKKNIYIYMI